MAGRKTQKASREYEGWNPLEGCIDFVEKERRKFQLNILRAAFNSVLAVTPPNKPGNRKLTQAAVKSLRKRILRDVIGSEDTKKPNLRTAVPNREGKPFLFRGDGGNMPLVVPRVKSKKGRSLIALANAAQVVDLWTRITQYKNTAHRYALAGVGLRWVSAADWVKAAKALELRAGELLAGWDAAARRIGSGSLDKVLPKNAKVHRRGWASVPEDTGKYVMSWEAENPNAGSRQVARYVERHLLRRLNSEAAYYAEQFRDHYLKAVKNHIRKKMK